MPITARIANAAKALMGISAYSPEQPMQSAPANEEQLRKMLGGNLQPILQTKTRWYMADLERAAQYADSGNLSEVGKLCRSMRRDGMISGLMGTRTSGLVSLPKRFRGDPKIVAELTDETGTRTLFDEMFPPAELALLAADGINVGVGVAELVPVVGRTHPVMVRLEPEFLQYRYNENRWYYLSTAGSLPITPGDGRWILHTPGGTLNPWTYGEWHALGRAYITKEHALLHRSNYSAKLANPARVGKAPVGASEDQRLSMINKLLQWGLNTVFTLPVGWDVDLLESNGRGYDVFKQEFDDSNLEIMITLAGQVVTVTGGTGFANADIHQTIRADLIKQTGLALAHTINTQGIPPYVYRVHGQAALANSPRLTYETDPPGDLKTMADAADSFGRGVQSANEALRPYDRQLDVEQMAARHHLPIVNLKDVGKDETPPLTLAPTDIAKVVKVDEARQSQGLEPIGDDRGDQTIQELTDAAKTEVAETQADASKEVAEMKPEPAPKPAGSPPAGPKALRTRRSMTALGSVLRAGEFKESDHPRKDDGKFGEGSGDSSDSSDSDDERPSPKEVHARVTSTVKARNAQAQHVADAKADVRSSGKYEKAADRQLSEAEKLEDKIEGLSSMLDDPKLRALNGGEVEDLLTGSIQGQKVELRTGAKALTEGWRAIAPEHAEKDPSDIKRELGITDKDAEKVDQLLARMNATRNEQAKHINSALAKIDAAAALHEEPGEDDWVHGAMQEVGIVTADREQLIDAITGGDSIKPVKDPARALKKVTKELDEMYG